MHSEQQLIWLHKTGLMFKLFPGLPGHLRQLVMHFGSGRDAYFIEEAYSNIHQGCSCDQPSVKRRHRRNFVESVIKVSNEEILVPKEKIFLQKNPFLVTCTTGCLCLPYYWHFYHNRIFKKIIWHWILIQILQGHACPPTHQGGVENCSKVYWI